MPTSTNRSGGQQLRSIRAIVQVQLLTIKFQQLTVSVCRKRPLREAEHHITDAIRASRIGKVQPGDHRVRSRYLINHQRGDWREGQRHIVDYVDVDGCRAGVTVGIRDLVGEAVTVLLGVGTVVGIHAIVRPGQGVDVAAVAVALLSSV